MAATKSNTPPMASSNGAAPLDFMGRVELLSKQLFPTWWEAQDLLGKIEVLRDHRVQLLEVEPDSESTSDEMAHAMMVTSDLWAEIDNFRTHLWDRVERLENQRKEAKQSISDSEQAKMVQKVLVVQQGGMLPPDEEYGSWEYGSEDGEGKCFSNIVQLNAVIKSENAKIDDLMDKINIEATMDGILRRAMSNFAVDAKFVSVELHEWSLGSDTCRHTRLPLAQAYERVLEWFAEKLQKALEEEKEEELQLLKAVVEIQEKESAAVASQEVRDPYIPRCFTCKKLGHVDRDCSKVDIEEDTGLHEASPFFKVEDHAATIAKPWEKKPKFCSVCNKPGHIEEYCRLTHPEEEEENSCDHCGKDGHRVDGCFGLHPDLLREFRRNRKPQVCRNCYKPGHLVKYCPDILPTEYGLRPARQV